MKKRELAAIALRLEADLLERRTAFLPGFTHRRIRGIDCFGAPPRGAFSPRVLGFGVNGATDGATLHAIIGHYRASGQKPMVVITDGAADARAVPLLKANRFKQERWIGSGSVLEVRSETAVRARAEHAMNAPVTVDRLTAAAAPTFERLMTAGFEMKGRYTLYASSTARALTAHPRSMTGFLARIDGEPAGSGAMLIRGDAALLYSGSVLPRARGHGVQPALIAARLLHGLDRGVRWFFVQTSQTGASIDNLRDAGFRDRWAFSFWTLH